MVLLRFSIEPKRRPYPHNSFPLSFFSFAEIATISGLFLVPPN
jgi:hypothetical protein